MMFYSALVAVGALAVTTPAFLIPGDIEAVSANGGFGAGAAPPAAIQQAQGGQKITLDCTSCPFALATSRNGQREWTADVASNLEASISSDGRTLLFNGVPFYPIQAPGLPPTLKIAQRKKEEETSTMAGAEDDLQMSYSLEMDEKHFQDANLVTVVMTVMSLEGQMIRVDNVEIKAIKDLEGQITLLSIETTPANPDSPEAQCDNVMCRVFAKVISGIQKAKASAKTAGHRMKCFCIKSFDHLRGHAHKHHHHHHNKGSGLHHAPPMHPFDHEQGFFQRVVHFSRIAVKIAFVPILIGIAFGMASSAIGMLVGQLVVFLWLRIRRSDEHGEYEQVDMDDKEVPPAYEDVPATQILNEKESAGTQV